MRILVLSDTFPPHNFGGAGEVAHLVSREYAARGHDVLVMAGATRLSEVGEATLDGMRVRRVWCPAVDPLRLHLGLLHPLAAAQIRRAAARFCPDVVHAHNVHERLSFAALGAARVGGAPLALTAHDFLLFCLTKFLCSGGSDRYTALPARCPHCRHIRRAPGRNAAVRRIVRRHVARVACISESQSRILGVNGYADVAREVVYNGIDPNAPVIGDEEKRDFRQRHGIDDRPLVFFGGRISGAKGGDQLIRAMAEARKHVDCQLAIAGDRPQYFAFARRLAAEVGLDAGALHVLGWLDGAQLDVAFAACDVVATPSVYPDPFNLMNVRGMAHGRPVVGTCYGATPEIVVDGETGLIADPWQPAAFGKAVAALAGDPERAARMGAAGRARVRDQFTLTRQVDQYVDLLRDVRCSDTLTGSRASATGL
ncbi:MAG TPA: glycosyltransferase family 4 protein [Chloroflexota bacterium]|nr:glycosyltransferase family 4 protein [Chloroflexota bacterium]